MPAFTTNQWAIVALVFVLGWLLGLASRSGGRRWRREYERERAAHLAYRHEQETRSAAADVRGVGPAAASTTVAATATHDDLTAIRGIDATRARALADAGIYGFGDVARLAGTEAGAIETRLGLAVGTVDREQWREQAMLLRDGHREDWARTYG